jgi:hypothetical protein
VTAAVPSPYLSPTAGFVDALRRLYIQLAPAYIAEREQALIKKQRLNRELTEAARTAADFADSERSGYIDRTGLEGL